MNIIDGILQEFAHENANTRKMLDRVPQQHLGWKPHAKSMTLGRLAGHIVEIPTFIKPIITQNEMVIDMANYKPTEFTAVADGLARFDKNIAEAASAMQGQTNDNLMKPWRLKFGDKVVFELPRIAVIRSMVISHAIHHRGQLSVFLRLQNVPLPPIYGPTADESPPY